MATLPPDSCVDVIEFNGQMATKWKIVCLKLEGKCQWLNRKACFLACLHRGKLLLSTSKPNDFRFVDVIIVVQSIPHYFRYYCEFQVHSHSSLQCTAERARASSHIGRAAQQCRTHHACAPHGTALKCTRGNNSGCFFLFVFLNSFSRSSTPSDLARNNSAVFYPHLIHPASKRVHAGYMSHHIFFLFYSVPHNVVHSLSPCWLWLSRAHILPCTFHFVLLLFSRYLVP